MSDTKEQQYNVVLDLVKKKGGATSMGLMANYVWQYDPRRLVFLLARYKFVAKMLEGKDHVLEIGCADAFGTRIVQQAVGQVVAVDFDPVFVEDVNARMDEDWQLSCFLHDMLTGRVEHKFQFDAAFSIDVLEHIQPKDEATFIQNIVDSVHDEGMVIIGTPSIQSQPYASEASKAGHVNCKDGQELKQLLQGWFHNVLLFSMNDELVHTGFHPLAHYLFVVCSVKLSKPLVD